MNTTNAGKDAETAAANYLERKGYTVIERNYRTPRCEIDIVARRGKLLLFVEVKYRGNTAQGSGLDYITSSKLGHMTRAAELWQQAHDWHGEISLAAIEVAPDFTVTNFIESIY